jgi:hypothetical protein
MPNQASIVDVPTLVFISWPKIASANVHFSFVWPEIWSFSTT